ncbi:MAG: DUF5110 domain-containing protein [Muribaculaceae bacterium]|nr:DUF5110 domain-containing protein [Muribaculaceae bacterium]
MTRLFISLMFIFSALLSWSATPIVEFVTPSIVRVRWTPDGSVTDNATGACVYQKTYVDVRVKPSEDGKAKVLITDSLEVSLLPDGALSFKDPATGETLLNANPFSEVNYKKIPKEKITYDENTAHMEETANGKVTVKDILRRDTTGYRERFQFSFTAPADEAIYGLGSHMEDYMDLTGKTLWLTQHNLKAFVPMIVSTGGFGLLIDAGCSMKFESKLLDDKSLFGKELQLIDFTLEAAKTIDYYFIKGEPQQVVADYRFLTGNVSMMPRYLFGYTQSKERYVSSDDIVNTLKEYRRRHVPIDMIVQDWNYWPQGWGYMMMNRDYYPDPKALADSVHAYDAKIMISIWDNPQYCPEEEDFRNRGLMLEHSVYDAFNPAGRNLFWDYADKEFFSNGFDAWWCDSSEPLDGDWNQLPPPENGKPYSWDDHERRWRLNDEVLSETLGAERACLYSLNHAKGIYDHQRAATDEKRVVNLTRSTWAGQQRYGTIVWNGDTHASWDSFRQQIPAGLNYFATGNPYWTVDVGSFFTRNGNRWFWIGEFPEGVKDDAYKEYYTRMFQWATFLPVLRSHGTDTPREIWQFGELGTPYYDAILSMINLRYSLLPYNYSMAAMQSAGGYSMARPLGFDFPKDRNVHDIKDQYMFGDIMVCPVTSEGADRREVYLPVNESGWIDFRTGEKLNGGQTMVASAPLAEIPLFVKGGSIIPTIEPVEHSGASVGKPVTVTIYPGADAEFTLYDDSGDGYGFERGEWQRIRFNWNDATRSLTISEAEGTYPGAPDSRDFRIRVGNKEKDVTYNGTTTTITLP